MILFDTETTGLLKNDSVALDQQPEIIELGAVKLDDETLAEVATLSIIIKPRILPLDPKITQITGITNEDLADKPSFARILPDLAAFFLGEKTIVAHNCAFDVGMLLVELRRLNYVHKFPWPSVHLCTVEANMDLRGYRLKLGDLFALATGSAPAVAHRALDDCRSLAEVVRWMKKTDRL